MVYPAFVAARVVLVALVVEVSVQLERLVVPFVSSLIVVISCSEGFHFELSEEDEHV